MLGGEILLAWTEPLTLSDQLRATSNRPSGFDYLRILLAIGVIASHAPLVCYGWMVHRQFTGSPFARPLLFFIVPSFFALSGFLVAGSLERNSLPEFLTLRGVRIFPALAVEIVLSALLIGPLVTQLPLGEYFGSAEFARYFLNVIGYIHYTLPGVFTTLPAPNYVNLQLWTVPRELDCYLLISLVSLIGLYARPRIMLISLVVACCAIIVYQQVFGGYTEHDNQARGALPILSFLSGVCLYALRVRTPFSGSWFLVALIVTTVSLSFPSLTYISPLAIAYVTVFFGLQNPRRWLVIRGADYSYGMYLYGFPIQQLLVFALPWSRIWYINLFLAIALSGVFAYISWNLVELPLHNRRKVFTEAVRRASDRLRAILVRERVASDA